MTDYVRLFSNQYDYKTTIDSVNTFIKEVAKRNPELTGKDKTINIARKQIYQLNKYKRQYNSKDFLGVKKGYKNLNNGEITEAVITKEHLEYAKKYLKLEDEYICYITMNKAIAQLIKGEITIEEIENRINGSKKNNTHNIEEIAGAVSDRKLSDINKASSEIVQANEEKEQNKTDKEEHGEE